MSRAAALLAAAAHWAGGGFEAELRRRVACRTHLGDAGARDAYLGAEIRPALERMGFACRVLPHEGGLFLLADRMEAADRPTVLLYGHGDVVPGMDADWAPGLDPWTLHRRGERLYGRGTADNKGQHGVVLAALACVLEARGGRLGFNAKVLMEMGEEAGSPGLRSLCRTHRDPLAADLLLASDGPRLHADTPTLFLGARGGLIIRLSADLRDGGFHPGNWGGLLANPATMIAAAVASLVDGRGRILADCLRPPPIPESVRHALSGVVLRPMPGDPATAPGWGEPGLTPAEQLYGWNTLEVTAMGAGDVARPANAIPGRAAAVCQLRFVLGTRTDGIAAALREHLAARGLGAVQVDTELVCAATRLDPEHRWAVWARASVERSLGRAPAVLPNFGGSLPNDIFVQELGLPTVWVPHSHPGCGQHGPDEHLLVPVVTEGLAQMAGLFWDLGDTQHALEGA